MSKQRNDRKPPNDLKQRKAHRLPCAIVVTLHDAEQRIGRAVDTERAADGFGEHVLPVEQRDHTMGWEGRERRWTRKSE